MSNYAAKWGPKGFIVDPTKVVPLSKLTYTIKRKAEQGKDTSGTPATNDRGMEPQEVGIETTYLAGAGVDPRGQLEEWQTLFGQKYPLYINGKRFGPDLLELNTIDVGDIVTDNLGNFIKVTMVIGFIEYVAPPAGRGAPSSDEKILMRPAHERATSVM